VTHDCKFCNWMAQLGSRDNHPVDADNDEDNANDFNRIDVSGGVGTITDGELFPIDDAADTNLLFDNADTVEPLVAVAHVHL
jgi:hypothetical protein